jgi:hydroxymethylglutaryl-CoA reductase
MWSGFYKKPVAERHQLLQLTHPHLFTQPHGLGNAVLCPTDQDRDNQIKVSNLTVENCIGVLPLPLALGLNFTIKDEAEQDFKDLPPIPMSIQEPSVVAACSSVAKWIRDMGAGGFHVRTYSKDGSPVMVKDCRIMKLVDGQMLVKFETPEKLSDATKRLETAKNMLLKQANHYCIKLRSKYGGGVVDIRWYQLNDTRLVLSFVVDVVEAMGANIVNTLLECMKPAVSNLTQGQIVMTINSNLCTHLISSVPFFRCLD